MKKLYVGLFLLVGSVATTFASVVPAIAGGSGGF